MGYSIDFAAGWILRISGIVPPFCVEVVLSDTRCFYLHSVCSYDKETNTAVLRVWDMRVIDNNDVENLKAKLNQMTSRDEYGTEGKTLHPKLDWANLRCNIDQIAYCVEWHDRLWPEEERPKMGFTE